MKVLITHAYTKHNKGDAAILSVLLDQVSRAFPKVDIEISTFDNVEVNKNFEGYKNIPSFLYLIVFKHKNVVTKAIYATYIVVATVIWALLVRFFNLKLMFLLTSPIDQVMQEMLASDLIVPIGGGYIRSKPSIGDTLNLFLVLHPIILALILRKKIVLYSQSIGPFYNNVQRFMAEWVLSRVDLIMAREDHTVRTLRKIGISNRKVVRTVDAGFLFKSNKKIGLSNYLKKAGDKTIVGVTVRKWLNKQGQQRYEDEVAQFLTKITQDPNIYVVFIPQVTSSLHHDDDRDVAKRIMKITNNKKQVFNIDRALSHHEIKAVYDSLDYIIGTRFHSVIFSLTSRVPAIAIEYEYKTSGIMSDLLLSDWVIPIEKVTSKILYEKFKKLLSRSKSYRKTLDKNLPAYINKAKENVFYLKKVSGYAN